MVRLTSILARVPAIKFRKGGSGGGAHAPPPSAPAAPAAAAPKSAVSISTFIS